MTRDTIIMAIVEGLLGDVLTYDVSRHHPSPGRPAKHWRSNKKKTTSPPLGRHNPDTFYPKATSSAARKPGSAPRKKSKVGKRLAIMAAPYAAFAAYKGYKSLRDRAQVRRMLKQAKKQDSRKKLKEAIVEAYFLGKDQMANKIPSVHKGRLAMMAQAKEAKRAVWLDKTTKAARRQAPGGDITRLPKYHKLRTQLVKARAPR